MTALEIKYKEHMKHQENCDDSKFAMHILNNGTKIKVCNARKR
jgi:hypothetical protein